MERCAWYSSQMESAPKSYTYVEAFYSEAGIYKEIHQRGSRAPYKNERIVLGCRLIVPASRDSISSRFLFSSSPLALRP